MKTLEQWYGEYGKSHRHPTNILVHKICVPTIYFSITGLLMSLPVGPLAQWLPQPLDVLVNWASIAMLAVWVFYLRLSLRVSLVMFAFSVLCLYGNWYIGQHSHLLAVSASLFVVAWVGQFWGHKVEGAKPSFFQDLQFLLIGPAWVFEYLFFSRK